MTATNAVDLWNNTGFMHFVYKMNVTTDNVLIDFLLVLVFIGVVLSMSNTRTTHALLLAGTVSGLVALMFAAALAQYGSVDALLGRVFVCGAFVICMLIYDYISET